MPTSFKALKPGNNIIKVIFSNFEKFPPEADISCVFTERHFLMESRCNTTGYYSILQAYSSFAVVAWMVGKTTTFRETVCIKSARERTFK